MQWIQKPSNPELTAALAVSLREDAPFRGTPVARSARILAPLLARRGITDAEAAQRYLSPSLSHLFLPEQLTGLRAAVERLDAAIQRKEPILIYGDYDVDGTMAVIIFEDGDRVVRRHG